mmetsp:Transcript_40111/g.86521  ORF Transcript_40111/g.86521 Transcript_40111/m.86521 type:complete len:114 (-) Transcript_40111:879-1220(-)
MLGSLLSADDFSCLRILLSASGKPFSLYILSALTDMDDEPTMLQEDATSDLIPSNKVPTLGFDFCVSGSGIGTLGEDIFENGEERTRLGLVAAGGAPGFLGDPLLEMERLDER